MDLKNLIKKKNKSLKQQVSLMMMLREAEMNVLSDSGSTVLTLMTSILRTFMMELRTVLLYSRLLIS